MTTFIVRLDRPSDIDVLKKHGTVGSPQTLNTFVIFESDLSRSEILALPGVRQVEKDSVIDLDYEEVIQENAPQWALLWLSHSDTQYTNSRSGSGVDIYVVDTGVRDTHNDLVGRVRNLWSFDDVFWSTEGEISPTHGTSVAACAAGTTYGTAKNATIVNVRIDFLNSTIVKALDVILMDHLTKDSTRPSIINFSGSSPMSMIGKLFEELTEFGIIPVAAAGNYSEDEPRYPALSWWVIAAGSLDQNGEPSYFTNRKCEVYAPGGQITTAHVGSDSATTVISGTSFASPYVAGLMACHLEGSDRFNTSQQVSAFQYQYYYNLSDSNRVPPFNNGGYAIRTANSTTSLAGDWYDNISLTYSNQDILEFVMANLDNPQVIADAARDGNVDAKRFSQVLGYSEEEINAWFKGQNVRTWWMTDAYWNDAQSANNTSIDSQAVIAETGKQGINLVVGITIAILALAIISVFLI